MANNSVSKINLEFQHTIEQEHQSNYIIHRRNYLRLKSNTQYDHDIKEFR